jgi:regulator of protease activity HflC (stomatin/prohibitin superfamily)
MGGSVLLWGILRAARRRAARARWLGLGAALALSGVACATVPPGYAGVVLTPSGVRPRPLGEGVSAVPPLSQVALYDLRVQTRAENLRALAADGAPLIARASVVAFHVVPAQLVALHREVGPEYYDRVVRPVVRSEVRRVLGGLCSDQITAAAIPRIQARIQAGVAARLPRFHVVADTIDLRNLVVDYSPMAYGVILQTGVLEQRALATPQLLAIERHRAEVRREEARGVSAQFRLVAPGLTPQVLADSATHTVGDLLAAPTTSVLLGTGATFMEVK